MNASFYNQLCNTNISEMTAKMGISVLWVKQLEILVAKNVSKINHTNSGLVAFDISSKQQ